MQLEDAVQDYTTAYLSRQLSIVARKEVAAGRAGFGIFGEGKELPQVAMARVFQRGDWRSGYYRDQTFMLALGALTPHQFFAHLYADADLAHHPHSGGRQMNNHFASTYYREGQWLDQTQSWNVAADMSCTSGQLPRLIGLGLASKLYRNASPPFASDFSQQGCEVAFGTIGDAATAEGHFWETVNAMGVLQIPVALSIWDDGYGISVPRAQQTTKGSLAEVLPGFASSQDRSGVEFYHVLGWDYPALIQTYEQAIQRCRKEHSPCIIHVDELTQPLGHSTSGSASRYKPPQRLSWEQQRDGLQRFRSWIIRQGSADESHLNSLEQKAQDEVLRARDEAFELWQKPLEQKSAQLKRLLEELRADPSSSSFSSEIEVCEASLMRSSASQADTSTGYKQTTRGTHHLHHTHDKIRHLKPWLQHHPSTAARQLLELEAQCSQMSHTRYHTHLHVSGSRSPLRISHISPQYSAASKEVDGREVIREFFDLKLKEEPRLVILGEDVAVLGGVNLEFQGLLEGHGSHRVMDTGIREATILGQGHGLAMRGFRPIVDIQYLDYLIFCLQGISDDVASLHYRSAGTQASPVIIRTKGHRLMGIWHAGSPMAMLLGSCRGLHLCTPRNMVQACGLYQTLLAGDDPALVIEPMNGYRIKERLPDNLGSYTTKLGSVEILQQGKDITVVSYGSCIAIAQKALTILSRWGVEVELIDCPTLLPFDLQHRIAESLRRTHSLVVMDEDVPGGASAYILKQILEDQQGYRYLDAPPITLTAHEHRPPYGVDGDYYSKPSSQDLVETCLSLIKERDPTRYQRIFQQTATT